MKPSEGLDVWCSRGSSMDSLRGEKTPGLQLPVSLWVATAIGDSMRIRRIV